MADYDGVYTFLKEFKTHIESTAYEQIRASIETSYSSKQPLVLKQFLNVYSQHYFQITDTAVPTALSLLKDRFDSLVSNIDYQCQFDYICLSSKNASRLSAVIASIEDYMPEDLKDSCKAIVPNLSQESDETALTIDRAIPLLSLLISLFALIVSLMPNPQLTELAEQNSRLIAIEEEKLALERQQTELFEDIANDLGDIIVGINEQIETQRQHLDILGEQVKDIDDSAVETEQTHDTNALNQGAYAEN